MLSHSIIKDVVDVYSYSSYDLSAFDLDAGSLPCLGQGIMRAESSNSIIGSDWSDASILPEGIPDDGVLVSTNLGLLGTPRDVHRCLHLVIVARVELHLVHTIVHAFVGLEATLFSR
jgi:hypothetical protein